jgi:hypothetical protein
MRGTISDSGRTGDVKAVRSSHTGDVSRKISSGMIDDVHGFQIMAL